MEILKHNKDILFLVEPFYNGIQYIDVAKNIGCELVILRRPEGPLLEDLDVETIIVDLFDTKLASNVIIERIKDINYENVGILPGTDFCVPIVAELTTALKLKGNSPQSANAARNKILMRECLNKGNVNCPKSMCFYDIKDILKAKNDFVFPLVIKPPDMTSSKFVRLVNNFDDLIDASNEIFEASINVLNYPVIKAVMIEEYVTGPEFSIELFLDDGVCKFASVTEKQKYELPHFVEIGHIVPSSITNLEQNQDLITAAYKAAMAIGLKYGPVHVEIVFGKNGPSIIELAGRIGGDKIMILVELATNVCLPSLAIQQVHNYNIADLIDNIPCQGAAIRYLTSTSGTIIDILGVDKVKSNKNVVDVNINVKIGDYINPILSSAERAGYIIATGKDSKQAYKTACKLANEIRIITS